MKKFDKNVQIKIFNIILIIIWMVTIFMFSAQQGNDSGDTSRKFTVIILKIITGKDIATDDSFVEGIQLFIRKTAHFTIFAIGGFLIMNYMYTTNNRFRQKFLYSVAIGGGYAVTDELHQFFVPGRSARLLDVGIDTAGVITGVILYFTLMIVIDKVKKKNHMKNS